MPIGVDLLVARTDHHRRLRAGDDRPRGPALRAVGDRLAQAGELIPVRRALVTDVRPDVAVGQDLRLPSLVAHGEDQVALVEVAHRVVPELERPARHELPSVARPRRRLGARPQLLQPHPRQDLAFARVVIAAGVLVHLYRIPARAGLRAEVEGGALPVPVVQRHHRRAHLAAHAEGVDVLGLGGRPGPLAERDPSPSLDLRVRGGVVAEHQRVAAALVVEPVGDPFLLQQPGDEVEVGLLVLDAVLPARIGPGEGRARRDAPFVQDLLHDLRDRQALEDPAPPPQAERPEARDDPGDVPVPVRPFARVPALEAGHEAVQEPLAAVGADECEEPRLPQEPVQLHALGDDDRDVDRVRAGDRLFSPDLQDPKITRSTGSGLELQRAPDDLRRDLEHRHTLPLPAEPDLFTRSASGTTRSTASGEAPRCRQAAHTPVARGGSGSTELMEPDVAL